MTARISELSSLLNLGPKSEQWLNEIGIFTRADLDRVGSIEVYRLLKQQGRPVSLNLVWAIEGALADIHWRNVPENVKSQLREELRGSGQI